MTAELEAAPFTPPPDTDTLIWRPEPTIDWDNATMEEHQLVWDYFDSKKVYRTWAEIEAAVADARTYYEFIHLLIHARRLSYLNQPYWWKSFIYHEALGRGFVLPSRVPKSFERK